MAKLGKTLFSCFHKEAKWFLTVGISFIMSGWEMMPNHHWNWDDWWTRSWCRGTMQCFSWGSQMKACCPHEHSAAAGQADCHQMSLPAKGWLSVLPMLCSLPWWMADCRLCKSWSGSLLLLGSSAQSQLPLQKSWMSMVCYSWMTLFRARHQLVVFPNTDTFPSFCVRAQKLSSFADWLELSYFFLGCWCL